MPMRTEGIRRLTLALQPEDHEVLRFAAFKRHLSLSAMVRELIRELGEDEEDIRDGLKALKEKGEAMDWETFKKDHLGL